MKSVLLLPAFIVLVFTSCCSPRLIETKYSVNKNQRVEELTRQLVDVERALCRVYGELDKPRATKPRDLTTDPEISYVETLYKLKVKLQAELARLLLAP